MNKTFQSIRQNAYAVVAFALLLALTVPNFFLGSVDAAQITSRSIKMSKATPAATGVTYEVNFTAIGAFQSFVIDFCSSADGPILGQACTGPTGFSVAGAALAGTTVQASGSTFKAYYAGSQTAGAKTLSITNVTNPSGTPGTFYARITTYTGTTYNGYTNPTSVGTYVDNGSVALATTYDVNVTAVVRETLTFCVSGAAPTAGCGGVTAPNLTLGEGSPKALSTSAVSTGDAYFQLSSNGTGGTTIRMKNNATSGGLNSGSNSIPPVSNATTPQAIAAGTANFGVRTASVAGGTGTLTLATTYAHATNYNMITEATSAGNGVDSTFGSILATTGGPISDKNATMTFGATISPTTPAGVYTAAISLIATSVY